MLAPDWTPACSDELYKRNRRMADEFGTGITTHVLETKSEMMFNLEAHGKTAMRRLADLGVLGPDGRAHFVWATDEDIAILADTGAVPAVEQPGVQPAAGDGHRSGPRHHGAGWPGGVRHRQHLVLRAG